MHSADHDSEAGCESVFSSLLLAIFVAVRHYGLMGPPLALRVICLTLIAVGSILSAPSAAGDEPGETDLGYLLVQQALGHLAHDSSVEGIEVAMEKVGDALETDNQQGVDVPTLERGMAALEAGDVNGSRGLLQESITEALHNPQPATGMQSGTTVVRPELPGRFGLAAQDWGFLAAAAIGTLVGAWLTFRFRPPDSIRALRTRLAGSGGPASQAKDG